MECVLIISPYFFQLRPSLPVILLPTSSERKICRWAVLKKCLVDKIGVGLRIEPGTLYMEASGLSVSYTHILGFHFKKAPHVFPCSLKPSVHICNFQLLSNHIEMRLDRALPEYWSSALLFVTEYVSHNINWIRCGRWADLIQLGSCFLLHPSPEVLHSETISLSGLIYMRGTC